MIGSMSRLAVFSSALLIAWVAAPLVRAQTGGADQPAAPESHRRLPFLGDLARDRGIELPLPFGVGAVYYFVSRDITVSDLRLGRDGATPTSIGEYTQVAAKSRVNNLNVKLDVWVLPFLNVYAIAGYVWNETDTTFDLTLQIG